MNPMELFNQVKEMIEKKDFEAAKKFVDENKDDLGEFYIWKSYLGTVPIIG